jgi:hypothetical protein
MFVQVFEAEVSDQGGLKKQMDRWVEEVRPVTTGYLGSTAGITDDGKFIAIARFESKEAAAENSNRPEQSRWFEETSRYFKAPATFHDCTDVQLWLGGGSDDAGFVQVIQGKVRDVERMKELIANSEADLTQNRTAVLGGLVAYHGDGGFTQAVYFTSEKDAREQERSRPAEADARIAELRSMAEGQPTYYDLRDPDLVSP